MQLRHKFGVRLNHPSSRNHCYTLCQKSVSPSASTRFFMAFAKTPQNFLACFPFSQRPRRRSPSPALRGNDKFQFCVVHYVGGAHAEAYSASRRNEQLWRRADLRAANNIITYSESDARESEEKVHVGLGNLGSWFGRISHIFNDCLQTNSDCF